MYVFVFYHTEKVKMHCSETYQIVVCNFAFTTSGIQKQEILLKHMNSGKKIHTSKTVNIYATTIITDQK
jgi:hypothetical protein